MKIVITGSAGHVAKPLTERLLSEQHEVTVVSRNIDHVSALVAKGATPAIGSVEDVHFLTNTFSKADAVYTMVPPNMAAKDWKAFIAQIGKNYAQAIKASGVNYVVNLSSNGADQSEGCGPVSGLHQVEKQLNELTKVKVLHLRAGYFYQNLLNNIAMIKSLGIMGANFGGPDLVIVMVDPVDVAEAAAEEFSALDFAHQSVRYVASDERSSEDIAGVIGEAIGKPDLKWVVFSDIDALNGMLRAGLPEEAAKNYVEMGHSMHTGKMTADYWKHHPEELAGTKLEAFAHEFAATFNAKEAMAAF